MRIPAIPTLRLARRIAFMAMGAALLTACALLAEHGKPDSALAHADLPYYGSSDLLPRWDWLSRQHKVGKLALQDQHGKILDEKLFDQGPTVVSFFFTACTTVCPVSTDLLLRAQASMASQGMTPGFLSISVTPQTDDAATLRRYARSTGLPSSWILASGNAGQTARFASESFFSDIATLGTDGLPPHLDRAFLVDRQRRIRGIYDARSGQEIIRLKQDVARLMAEQQQAG
jgi:cytochrome oxidase Cu insertion factor (SCO1/SenC/PrrC family)